MIDRTLEKTLSDADLFVKKTAFKTNLEGFVKSSFKTFSTQSHQRKQQEKEMLERDKAQQVT